MRVMRRIAGSSALPRRSRAAGLISAGTLALLLLTWLVDVPTPQVPRQLHLLLLPLALLSALLLQQQPALWRRGLPALQLAAFTVLAASASGFGRQPLLDDGTRALLCALVGPISALSFAALLALALRAAGTHGQAELDFARGIGAGEIGLQLLALCHADGRICGAEALMRWQHRERGPLPPAEFVAMAERSGLIVPASAALLRQACTLLARWRHEPALEALTLAVNISPVQFRDAAAMRELLDIVATKEVPAGRLKFELTESLFIDDADRICAQIAACRERGIAVALDDFGTGYSTLATLQRMPLDELKVDESFVRGLDTEPEARAIVRSIVKLGRELGLEVVAEGVETRQQLALLQSMGCQRFQGFLFSQPQAPAEFERQVRSASRLSPARAGDAQPRSRG